MLDIVYNLMIESRDEQVLVDLGNSPNWVKVNKDLLARAKRISLLPKDDLLKSVVTVNLAGNRQWIYFSRVIKQLSTNVHLRLYCIGWQENVRGKTVKSLTWIYPNGTIEIGEEPTFVNLFLQTEISEYGISNG